MFCIIGRFSSYYIFKTLSGFGYKVKLYENEKGLVNVVAEMGNGSPSLVFNTHIDTVGPGKLENWDHNPFESKIDSKKLSASPSFGALFGRGLQYISLERTSGEY